MTVCAPDGQKDGACARLEGGRQGASGAEGVYLPLYYRQSPIPAVIVFGRIVAANNGDEGNDRTTTLTTYRLFGIDCIDADHQLKTNGEERDGRGRRENEMEEGEGKRSGKGEKGKGDGRGGRKKEREGGKGRRRGKGEKENEM